MNYQLPRQQFSAREADLDILESATDRVLAEVGLRFIDDPETLDIWRQHGAIVNGDRVFLDGKFLREVIKNNAPQEFTLRARNPFRDIKIGSGAPRVFAPVYGAPNVINDDGSRYLGSIDSYHKFVRIAHEASAINNTGHMICVPSDVPEVARPIEMLIAHLSQSDKALMGSSASPIAAEQTIDALFLAYDREHRAGECNSLHLINSTPPLTYTENSLKCLRTIAKKGQAVLVTSYMMMGATSPAAPMGSLIQGYAEVLAGIALAQLCAPGASVIMGIFATPFDMRSMLPRFGDATSTLVQTYSVPLARRLGIPVRGDGCVTSSKTDDAQAGYEGGTVMSAAILSGADFIIHSAGWLENGRSVSTQKFRREALSATVENFRIATISKEPLPLDSWLLKDLRSMIARQNN